MTTYRARVALTCFFVDLCLGGCSACLGRVGGVLGGRLGLAVGSEACSAAGSEGGPADSREASDGRHARTGTGRPGRACGSGNPCLYQWPRGGLQDPRGQGPRGPARATSLPVDGSFGPPGLRCPSAHLGVREGHRRACAVENLLGRLFLVQLARGGRGSAARAIHALESTPMAPGSPPRPLV